jgi:hypothetical protein
MQNVICRLAEGYCSLPRVLISKLHSRPWCCTCKVRLKASPWPNHADRNVLRLSVYVRVFLCRVSSPGTQDSPYFGTHAVRRGLIALIARFKIPLAIPSSHGIFFHDSDLPP